MNKASSNRSCLHLTAAVILFLLVIPCISSQERELRYKPHLDITLSPSAVISMVTVYPGDEIYSLFGHSSFRVYDPENRIDWMYNYGTFDFDDPAFVPKFVSGKLEYYLDINSYQSAFKFYKNVEKRKIVEQMLDLDPKEKQKLFDFLQDNGEMEDRFYKYDFIWDNCSTRIADALDKALPGLADYSAYKSTGESFRTMIRQYLASRPFTDFGIQLALGSGADAVPQGNEVFFLPLPMMEAFSSAVIGSKGGVPLVYEELVPGESDRVYTKRGDYPLIIFTSLLVLYAVLLLLLYRRRSSVVPEGGARGPHLTGTAHTVRATHIVRPARIAIRIIESSVFLLTGIAGIIISYLWFFSDHTITAANFNLLWCTPLNLILLFTWPEKDNPPAGRKAVLLMQIVSLALFALCAISLLCALLRAQAFLPAFLPLILIIMTAEWRRALGWIKVKK